MTKNHRIVYNPGSIIQLYITLSHQIHVVIADFLSSGRPWIFLRIGRRGRERSAPTATTSPSGEVA